jgi:hypothetical protein
MRSVALIAGAFRMWVIDTHLLHSVVEINEAHRRCLPEWTRQHPPPSS